MIISDLNQLEVVEATEVVGGIDSDYQNQNLYFNERVYIDKYITSRGYAVGHVAFAEADADAVGYGTLAQGLTRTYTSPYSSSASSTSVSVTSY